MSYSSATDTFADADAKIELAQALFARVEPIAGTPAETYLIKTRRLPADTVGACADLRYLPPPIEGRPPQDHALVSLLRDAAGEVSGFQLEFMDITGARTGEQPSKQSYAMREHGVRDGLFCAGGSGEVAYLTEGYSAKALAVASLGIGRVYGGGGRGVLGHAAPVESTVVIVPDRRPDDKVVDFKTGKSAAYQHDVDYKRAVDLLLLAGKAVLISKAPECQHAGGTTCKDSDDYLRRHGPINLKGLIETAEITALSLDGEARRLAQIEDPLERDQRTKAKATELKVKVALLRDRVAHYRERGRAGAAPGGEDAPGKKLEFDKLGMASEPVVGHELLDDLAAAIRRHAFIDEHDVVKAVLWAVHGHRRFHNNVQVLPRLVITAGREDSGKTSLAVALAHVTDTSLLTVSPRPSNLYRAIEAHQVALFLDEADVWYPRNEDLREIVNSGFNRDGAAVMRTEDVGSGGKRELEVRLYSTFTPMAIVGIDLERILARTLLSRGLIIRMTPARVGEVTEDIFANPPAVRTLRGIASRAKRWIADHERALIEAKPEMPGVINRLRLVWEPLLAIADAAGGSWPQRARAALEAERGRNRDPNLGETLLLDAMQIMEQTGVAGLHTKELIEKLLPLEMRSWSAYGKRRVAIRDIEVAELLAPYGLKPKQLKIGAINRRGYKLEDIQAAVARYVCIPAPETPEECYPATSPGEPQDTSGFEIEPQVAGSGADATFSELKAEVAATEELDATAFPEQNPSGIGVAASSLPSHTHTSATTGNTPPNGADGTTATLVCTACGAAFTHDTAKRGRRPSKCPDCRGGGAREHSSRHSDDHPAAAEADRITAGMAAGTRCGRCGVKFRPGEPVVEIGGRPYHDDDACAGEIRRRMATGAV